MRQSEFPKRLRALRERRRMTRIALAECCGLSKNAVARYERGEREPKIETLILLADFFDCSVDYLVGRHEKNF